MASEDPAIRVMKRSHKAPPSGPSSTRFWLVLPRISPDGRDFPAPR